MFNIVFSVEAKHTHFIENQKEAVARIDGIQPEKNTNQPSKLSIFYRCGNWVLRNDRIQTDHFDETDHSKKKKRLMIIGYATTWGLWKLRNDRIFRGSFTSPSNGVDYIKSLAYTWIKYRGN
ncbi:hypothetical protein LXL04_020417 [Taraxacum kok-saghyz]